jgi:hypothetical protein
MIDLVGVQHSLLEIHSYVFLKGYAIGPLWVKSSLSIQAKSYHLSGWYWGIPDTRHSEYRGMPVAGFGHKRTSRVSGIAIRIRGRFDSRLATSPR